MQKGFIKYLLLFFFIWTFSELPAQNDKTHQYAVFLLNKTGVIQDINASFQSLKYNYIKYFQEVLHQKKALFTQAEDSIFIINQINNLIKFEKNNLWDRIVFQEKSKGKRALKKLIRLSEKDTTLISDLRKKYQIEIQNFTDESFRNFKQVHLTGYIKIIKGQKTPIPLKIFINGEQKEKLPDNFQMFLLLKNIRINKIPIIDSQKKGIIKNPVNNYQDIYALLITYNHKNFILLPDKNHLKMPGQFKKMKNFLSKINFIKNNPWNIYIDETPEKITISLENTGFAKAESKKLIQE